MKIRFFRESAADCQVQGLRNHSSFSECLGKCFLKQSGELHAALAMGMLCPWCHFLPVLIWTEPCEQQLTCSQGSGSTICTEPPGRCSKREGLLFLTQPSNLKINSPLTSLLLPYLIFYWLPGFGVECVYSVGKQGAQTCVAISFSNCLSLAGEVQQ